MLHKLARHFDAKYQLAIYADNYYAPGTIPPAFKSGDIVLHKATGRKAVYLSPVTWQDAPGKSVIHYINKPITVKDNSGNNQMNFSYVDDLDLEPTEE